MSTDRRRGRSASSRRATPRSVHFVGIGGIGMSGIAEVLLNLGYRVSGSDLKESRRHPPAGRSWARRVATATRAENLLDADVVVISSAVQQGQPRGASPRGSGRSRSSPARRCSPS